MRPTAMTRRFRMALGAAAILGLFLLSCTRAGGGAVTSANAAARLALQQQERFAGIAARDESLIGQAGWYEVAETDDGWDVLIRIGWGDCPAGCIHEHRWTYHVTRAGAVSLLRETGDPMPDKTDVSGLVTAGPTCPVETDPPNPACAERPVAGAELVILDQDGTEVARARTGEDGSFTIKLVPGSYRLVPQPVDGLMGTAQPVDFVVQSGQPVSDLQVSYDTGIR
jgi:hypothetical protein